MFSMSTAVTSIPTMKNSAMMNPATEFYVKNKNHNGVKKKFKLGRYPSLLKIRSLLRLGATESGRA